MKWPLRIVQKIEDTGWQQFDFGFWHKIVQYEVLGHDIEICQKDLNTKCMNSQFKIN